MSLVKELIKDLLPEQEEKIIATYGGGFKPPTKGHFEVVKKSIEENPDIDEFIIYVGSGERNGITQAESISIWEIYKQYLPTNVKLEPSKGPIGDIIRLGKNNPQDKIYFILGARDGDEGDLEDIKNRTKTIDSKHSNIEVKIITTKNEGISGTNARNASKISLDKFKTFVPTELSDEEIEQVYNIVADKITESVNFVSLEKTLDDMFEDLGIDINFTKHFKERVISRGLTEEDIIELMEKIYDTHGDEVADLDKDENRVFTHIRRLIDIAAVNVGYGEDYLKDLVLKTAYKRNSSREPEFKTNNTSPKLKVNENATYSSKIDYKQQTQENLNEEIDLDKYVEDWLGKGGVHDSSSINRVFVLKLKQLGYKDFGTIYRILSIKNATKIPDLREYIWTNYNGKNISFSKTLEGAKNFMDQLTDQDLLEKGETFVIIKQKSNYYDLSGWVENKIKEAGGPWGFSTVKDHWTGGLYRETQKTQEVLSTLSNNFEVEGRYSKRGKPLNENASYSQNIDIKKEIAKLTKHMIDKGMNIQPLPNLKFINGDRSNAQEFLGKTAYYDPNSQTIVLYTEGRHPKDIVRSFSHEMVHHTQNLEGRLGDISTTNTQEDDNLNDIEAEANLKGTMTFRNWTDSLNENKLSLDDIILLSKTLRDKDKMKQIHSLLVQMFPKQKEFLDYNYKNDQFNDFRPFIFYIDEYIFEGPKLIPYTELKLDPDTYAKREKKYKEYIEGKIDKYFNSSNSDPRKVDLSKVPPITIDAEGMVAGGNHRAFLAIKQQKPLKAHQVVKANNTHPNVGKILNIIGRKKQEENIDPKSQAKHKDTITFRNWTDSLNENLTTNSNYLYHWTSYSACKKVIESNKLKSNKSNQFFEYDESRDLPDYKNVVFFTVENERFADEENSNQCILVVDKSKLSKDYKVISYGDPYEETVVYTNDPSILILPYLKGVLLMNTLQKSAVKKMVEFLESKGIPYEMNDNLERKIKAKKAKLPSLKKELINKLKLKYPNGFIGYLNSPLMHYQTPEYFKDNSTYSHPNITINKPGEYGEKNKFQIQFEIKPQNLEKYINWFMYSPDSIEGLINMDNYEGEELWLKGDIPIDINSLQESNLKDTMTFRNWTDSLNEDTKDPFGLNQYARELMGEVKSTTNEGRYDTISNKVSSLAFKEIKDIHDKGDVKGTFEFSVGPAGELNDIEYGDLEFDVEGHVEITDGIYKVDGGSNAGVDIEGDEVHPFISIKFQVPKNPKWQEVSMDLKDVARHEIEHLTQDGLNLKPNKYTDPQLISRALIKLGLQPDVEYYKLDSEIDAMLQGMYFKAKKSKTPFKKVINDYLNKVGLNDQEKKEVITIWRSRRKALSLPMFESEKSNYMLFVDLDGVLADFDKGYKELTGVTTKHADAQGKEEFWGLFLNNLNDKNIEEEDYWANLEWMSDGKELWDYVKEYKPYVLSAPSTDQTIPREERYKLHNNSSMRGKNTWGQRLDNMKKMYFRPAKLKSDYAGPNKILIDDRKDTIDMWNQKGGIGIHHTSTASTIDQLKKLNL